MSNLKIILALFVLGIFLLAPSAKVLADSSAGQTTESHNTEKSSESQHTSTGESSSDSNHNGVSDLQEKQDQRQVQQDVNTQDGQAQFQSELQSGSQKNSFQFQLEAKEKVQFSFHYKSESSNAQSQIEMKFEFRQLVEFIDNTSNVNNTVNGLDKMDTVVQSIDFQSLNWNMAYVKSTVGSQSVYNVNVTATQGNMLVEFSFYVSTGFVNQTDHLLTPNSVKFNVEIKDFPFQQSNSLLAAEVKIKNEVQNREIQNETEDHKAGLSGPEQQLSFDNNSVGAFFSWATSYTADGVNKTVVVSPVTSDHAEDGTQAKMYFNFAHANDIYWDPEVGVTRSSTTGSSSTPGFEFLAILVVPIVAILLRKKRISK